MATMVKEKKREKKKSKEKCRDIKTCNLTSESTLLEKPSSSENTNLDIVSELIEVASTSTTIEHEVDFVSNEEITQAITNEEVESTDIAEVNLERNLYSHDATQYNIDSNITLQKTEFNSERHKPIETHHSSVESVYKEVSKQLESLTLTSELTTLLEQRENELSSVNASLSTKEMGEEDLLNEHVTPSAPVFEEIPQNTKTVLPQEVVSELNPKISCMPIDEVIRICGGSEMEEVILMSEREEAIVEAGPMSGPEHPLMDLLSTFRSSLIAVERERIQLAQGYVEEEMSRSTLWKIEKRHVNVSEKCACGGSVDLRATYEHATLLRDRLPAAKLRLEGLLRDVQESYCHHQHAALLAHCQIEELISETVQANKNEIREALSLILQALRRSDNAPAALASALQRWAVALSAALVDARDLRQALFLLHHLFRQTRSVSWASRVLHVSVESAGWSRTVAVLGLLLHGTRLSHDIAQECTEEIEEAWEEVDKHGGGGAVSEGTLRERDLLVLVKSLPLSEIAARLLFGRPDIRDIRPHEWGDTMGGRRVLRACYGTRTLLATLQAGTDTHTNYARLKATLRTIAASTLHGLASLHLTSRAFYRKDLEEIVIVELEAVFVAGFRLFGAEELHRLPASLLSDDTAKEYCIAFIVGWHDTSPKPLRSLRVQLPVVTCDMRVRIVTQAAIDRADDHELATIVLEFLLQAGVKRKTVQCKGRCDSTARDSLPQLLAAHPYLYAVALHLLADINQSETLDVMAVKAVNVHKWRASSGEIRTLLDDWSQRCTQLLQYLLLELDYTPYVGIALEVQLTIGAWLTEWVKSHSSPIPEWCWSTLRRLRVHRASWHLPSDAPPPYEEPIDLFSTAYALMATEWGHSIPLICSEGVSALCKLAASRPREAVQCLANVMLVTAHSPESVALTPKFTELFTTLLNSGPSLMQRALGRGGVSGSELLLRLMVKQLAQDRCGDVNRATLLSVWLHALWRATLPAAAGALADIAALATREWPHLDVYAASLLQEENAKDHVNYTVRNASTAPLLCECILRACHTHETRTHTFTRLLSALARQRAQAERIHVDNALQQIGVSTSSEELVIYRAANAAMAAPLHHPSHLTLWRLFMHLYLQRLPEQMLESTPPVGPLFFSGLIKSRTLTQIKRRLQDTITYHRNETEALKQQQTSTKVVTQSTKKTKKSAPVVDDGLLPELSIVDLTGESSSSSDSDESVEESTSERIETTADIDTFDLTKNVTNLIIYHTAAEKLATEYLRWLEEGEKVCAAPHHADIARFIPEHALDAAWNRALALGKLAPSTELDSFPLPQRPSPQESPPPQTPFHKAVASVLKIRDHSKRRKRRININSPVEDVDFKDSRTLMALVEKHLKDIERLAQEWCNEVSRVSSLDGNLWQLVSALRVRRQLPPVKKQCPQKCKPVTLYIPAQEWCISSDAERGIKDNRSNARSAIRRLARPRPHVANTAAALHAIARRVRSSEAGVRVAERAWRCAAVPQCGSCAPAHAALTALLEHLAERWICHDGKLSTELVSRWCNNSSSALQTALCGALVAPRRLPASAWPPLYSALLTARLPPHAAFSYLSKFELSWWSERAESGQRRDMLDALLAAAQRFGPAPRAEHSMLVELIGVHTSLLLDAREIGNYILSCARASVTGKLPPTHWTHVVKAADVSTFNMPFDQLGHLLRELGVIWWEARTGLKSGRGTSHAAYAPYIARLLHALQRAFVATGRAMSYVPEKVSWYAWSALRESWSAWISPHPAALPLLPSTADNEQYTPMLRHFVDNVHQIMLDCPGSEVYLLQQIFEWCVQTYGSVQAGGSVQESRVQASALLAELANLPWTEHHWFYGKCLEIALQVSTSTDKEITAWCCTAWSKTSAATMMSDCKAEDQLAPTLASLLYLFTSPQLQHSIEILQEATVLPWWRLPEPALDEALDRFFMVYHNPNQPYHDLPQFIVVLFASELRQHPDTVNLRQSGMSRRKRCVAVSQWVRAACAPALISHVAAHSTTILNILTELAPYLEGQGSEGELEELLSRAVVIMCIEPAASAALPVWVRSVVGAWWRLSRAMVSAAAAVTVWEHFAALADAAARAHMLCDESNGWCEISERWRSCPWREPRPLIVRCRLHAAYGTALQHSCDATEIRDAIPALMNADINFVDNEPIVAVWICYVCRIARSCWQQQQQQAGAAPETRQAARALLARWAAAPRRSILRAITLQADTQRPTPVHRLLCRFAEYLLSPSECTSRAYESACTGTVGSSTDLASWACSPQASRLPRLAARLLPLHDRYFNWELDKAPDESAT